MKEKYNIIININSSYVVPACVMLTSFHENTENSMLYVLVLHSNLSDDEKNVMLNHVGDFAELHFVNASENINFNLPVTGHITIEAYYRVFAFIYLPQDVERAIYIDSDMIVNKSLKSFYNRDFGENYLIACEDKSISHIRTDVYSNLGIPITEKYFNSGLILFNVKKMKADSELAQKIQKYIFLNNKKIIFHDQDVLNGFFYKRCLIETNEMYNCFVTRILCKGKMLKIKKDAYIIHYVDQWKPWLPNYIGYLQDVYFKYAELIGENKKAIYTQTGFKILIQKIGIYSKRRIRYFLNWIEVKRNISRR